jgi:small conductance mechanosensitive channel
MDLQVWIDKAYDLILDFGPKLIGAILIYIIGSWIIKLILNSLKRFMEKASYEESLKKFLINLLRWSLKIILLVVILGIVGIETTSFAAILAAAGLAVGLALQGSLANFAGGVLIMIFKPFKIGDLIEAQGEIGVVKEIEIFTTKLTGLSNKEIIIPNGTLSNGNVVNYSVTGTRRVDLVIGVDYASDIKQTKEVLMNVLKAHPSVINEPAPSVNLLELADSSINFAVRPWCKTADYWTVYFEVMENIKLALDKAGIEIPYPHRVNIQKKS